MIEERNELRDKALQKGRSTDEIAPPIPTPETDAAPPGDTSTKFVFLAGAIKYWWLHRCPVCGMLGEQPGSCSHWETPHRNEPPKRMQQLWDSPDHQRYLRWRRDLRAALIAKGFLTYAPHEAFKGRWDERAQAVNDAGIAASDVMVVMSQIEWLSEGTEAEVIYAEKVDTPVIYLAPPTDDNWDAGLKSAAKIVGAVALYGSKN